MARKGLPIAVGEGCGRIKVKVGAGRGEVLVMCKAHPDLYLNICRGCGEYFHATRVNVKTCSDKCRQRVSRQRHDKMLQLILTIAGGD